MPKKFRLLKWWPVGGAILVAVCSVDLIIIPTIRYLDLGIFKTFLLSSLFATCELFYWYFFWGWFGGGIESVRNDWDSFRFPRCLNWLKRFIGWMIKSFIKIHHKALDPANRTIRFIKWGGLPAVVGLGLEPVPMGTRVLATAFCRNINWRLGFIVLAITNLVHVAYVVGGMELLFRFLGK